MKRQLLKFMATCGVLCAAGIVLNAASYRQAGNIPFAFHAGKIECPAGRYVFAQAPASVYQTLMNVKTGEKIILTTESPALTGDAQPRVVFHQYGKQYFLSEVWSPAGTGTRLHPSAVEKEARQEVQQANLNIPLVARR